MNDIAFVETIELAHDDRLGQRTRDAGDDDVRRGGDGSAAEADLTARAAVNGGSIISFTGNVTPEEKSDCLYSTQLAQRAASAQHDRHSDIEAWYRVYSGVLERLGWIGQGLAFKQMNSRAGEFTMDRSALDVIAEIATGGQLAILVRALDTLRALSDTSDPIRVFELQSRGELGGNFQLGTAQRADNGSLALALGAFHFRSENNRRGVLFWKWGDEKVDFWTAAQTMTLNRQHYAPLRATVRAKLGTEAADYLVGLAVK